MQYHRQRGGLEVNLAAGTASGVQGESDRICRMKNVSATMLCMLCCCVHPGVSLCFAAAAVGQALLPLLARQTAVPCQCNAWQAHAGPRLADGSWVDAHRRRHRCGPPRQGLGPAMVPLTPRHPAAGPSLCSGWLHSHICVRGRVTRWWLRWRLMRWRRAGLRMLRMLQAVHPIPVKGSCARSALTTSTALCLTTHGTHCASPYLPSLPPLQHCPAGHRHQRVT